MPPKKGAEAEYVAPIIYAGLEERRGFSPFTCQDRVRVTEWSTNRSQKELEDMKMKTFDPTPGAANGACEFDLGSAKIQGPARTGPVLADPEKPKPASQFRPHPDLGPTTFKSWTTKRVESDGTPGWIPSIHTSREVPYNKQVPIRAYRKSADLNGTGLALIAATAAGNMVEVKRLIQFDNADVNARTKNGSTPLHYAVGRANPLDTKTITIMPGALTMSPLRPSMQMALVLLQKGADVNAQEHVEIGHSTALHHAIRNKDLVMAEMLIGVPDLYPWRASLNTKDSLGMTPLHIAARGGQIDACKLLLSKGCETDQVDKQGRTALYWAKMMGHFDVLALVPAEVVQDNAQYDFVEHWVSRTAAEGGGGKDPVWKEKEKAGKKKKKKKK